MIKSFRHKGLALFFMKSDRSKINAKHVARIRRILDTLDVAAKAEDMNLPGLDFHPLTGDRKGTDSVSVSGNWRITFRFVAGDVLDVNLEDYH